MLKLSRPALLDAARTIAEDYRDQGYSLTLRQLFYQCVAGAIIPNADESYKRLIRDNVEMHWDPAVHQDWQDQAEARRTELTKKMRDPEWISKAL